MMGAFSKGAPARAGPSPCKAVFWMLFLMQTPKAPVSRVTFDLHV